MSVATETRLDTAIEGATARLLELQHADGYWVGELESNVTMTAQHLFWHHVLGLRTPDLDRKIANELLARQRGRFGSRPPSSPASRCGSTRPRA